jgi:hypothetical protein
MVPYFFVSLDCSTGDMISSLFLVSPSPHLNSRVLRLATKPLMHKRDATRAARCAISMPPKQSDSSMAKYEAATAADTAPPTRVVLLGGAAVPCTSMACKSC